MHRKFYLTFWDIRILTLWPRMTRIRVMGQLGLTPGDTSTCHGYFKPKLPSALVQRTDHCLVIWEQCWSHYLVWYELLKVACLIKKGATHNISDHSKNSITSEGSVVVRVRERGWADNMSHQSDSSRCMSLSTRVECELGKILPGVIGLILHIYCIDVSCTGNSF